MAFVFTQMQLILVVRQLFWKAPPPFTLMLMVCGERRSVSQTDPIATCKNEQINEVFSLHMRCQRTGSRGQNFTTCKIHKRDTKISFILDFSHSTIEPTF